MTIWNTILNSITRKHFWQYLITSINIKVRSTFP